MSISELQPEEGKPPSREGQPRVAGAYIWAIAGSGTQYVSVFLLLVYLAHVLHPRDFGLMATVTIGLDVGMQIARWGQVELLQQLRYRNDEARNQSFRLSLAIAAVFATVFLVAARPLGRLYSSEQLTQMIYICAPVFLFSAASATAEAILRSQFRFRALAIRNTVTTLVGGAVAIILATMGYGALALAVQRLIQAALAAILVWYAVDWRPRLGERFNWSPVLIRDGAQVMTGTVLPLLVPRSVDFFVSFVLGPIQLGLMRIAFRMNDFVGQIVVMPLVGVANAQLSGAAGNLEAMRRSYLRATQASAALMCPFLIGLAWVAPEAVPILFGQKWVACVPLVQTISLLSLVAPVNYYFSGAMVALGHGRLVLRQGLFQLVIGLILAIVAAQISLEAVVIAHVIRGTLVGGYNVADLKRRMGLRLIDLGRFMAPPYISTGIMSLALLIARMEIGDGMAPLPKLIVLTLIGGLAYVGALYLGERLRLWHTESAMLSAILPRRFRKAAIA